MEKLQIVGFTIQEIIISGIYIYKAREMVQCSFNAHTNHCILVLVLVQVACILLDVPFIVLAYTEIFLMKAVLTSFAYAIKLKLEFLVLNQLVNIVKKGIAPRGIQQIDEEQVAEPSTRRPFATALESEKRRFSLTPFKQRSSMSPSLPSPVTKTPGSGQSEKSTGESGLPVTSQVDGPG